jgi:iron uptake system component EfeO
MHTSLSPALAGAAAVAIVLSGCVPNSPTGTALTVAVTDSTCAVSAATAVAGSVSFAITNTGTGVNEFEILGPDKVRIVGEKEDIAPGPGVSFVAQLEPGTYYTACKFEQTGELIGLARFTVTAANGSN